MVLPRFLSTVICAVLIATGAVSGVDVMKPVGDQVSFRPDKLPEVPSITSVIWKHIANGTTVKAIEWDEGETELQIPNPRFKGITTVDEKTGQITITNLKFEHSGVYFFEINSKEQQQRFTLTIKERVPKPVIKIEKSDNPDDAMYLRCEYSEPIIWKNSTGHTLMGSSIRPKGESLTVHKNGNPEDFYTCTLDNGASKETSDPVFEKDLFKAGSKSGSGLIVGIVFLILLIFIIIVGFLIFWYKRNNNFKERVDGCFPCLGENEQKTDGPESVVLNTANETKGAENNDVKESEQQKTQEEAPISKGNGVEGDYVNSEMNVSPSVDDQTLVEKL